MFFFWLVHQLDTSVWKGGIGFQQFILVFFSSWPLVGNEGMNPQYTNVKVDSLIPYKGQPVFFFFFKFWFPSMIMGEKQRFSNRFPQSATRSCGLDGFSKRLADPEIQRRFWE